MAGRLAHWTTPRAAAIALLVAAAAIRLFDVAGPSVWLDESVTAGQARVGLRELLGYVGRDNHMPLHHCVIWLVIRLFGSGELALRLPSVVFGVATVWIAGRIARAAYGRAAELAVIALLAVSPLHVTMSQEGRPYALLGLLGTAALACLARFVARPSWGNAVAWVVVDILLVYSHYYAVFLVAAANAYVCWRWLFGGPPRPPLVPWLLMQAAVVLAYLPWLPNVLKRVKATQQGFWIPEPSLSTYVDVGMIYVGWAAPFAAALLVYGWVVGRRPATALHTWWFALPTVAPLFLSFTLQPMFYPKYTIASSVAGFILVAAALARLPRWRAPAVVLMVALQLHTLVGYLRSAKPEFRQLVALLAHEAGPTDAVVMIPSYDRNPYNYYRQRQPRELLPVTTPIARPIPAWTTVWLVRDRYLIPPGRFDAGIGALTAGRHVTLEVSYYHLLIQRWQLRDAH